MTTTHHGILHSLSEALAGAVEQAGRSIVTVHGRRRLPASGIVWSEDTIVTADHTLEREEDITVTLPDGRRTITRLAGRDPGSDIAVLRAEGVSLPAATLAPAGSLKVGHFVLALGRPGTSAPMASFGIVSALGGTWRTARGGLVEGYIRADVSLYPGFSGGPLVDIEGRVVGLNSTYLAGGQPAALPVGFLAQVVGALLTQGRVRRAFLGITSQPVQLPSPLADRLGLAQEGGLMVLRVEPGSPAEEGGLLIGDIVVAFGGKAVTDGEELQRALGPSLVGKTSTITIIRGGELKELHVTPGERS